MQANYLYDNLARGIVNGVVTFYPGRQTNREVDGANVTVKKFYTLACQYSHVNAPPIFGTLRHF